MVQKIRCIYCYAPFEFEKGEKEIVCPYCNRINEIVDIGKEDQEILDSAASLRSREKFDDAAEIYDRLIDNNPENISALWGKLLCKYGVVYLEKDDGSGEYCITCRKSLEDIFTQEPYYEKLISLASSKKADEYREDAEIIENIQRKILSGRDIPYDIFICYKETDKYGRRTDDSQDAELLYKLLKMEGYRVFYGRLTLRNKVGSDYEAAIYNAIENSRIMLVLGSDRTYFTSTWVQSEWQRFCERIKENPSKRLIPLYKKISPGRDLPEGLRSFQGMNLQREEETGYQKLRLLLAQILGKKESTKEGEYLPSEKTLEGNRLYSEGKIQEAMECYREAAKDDDSEAYYHMASIYYDKDTEEDLGQAVINYQKAAQYGHPEAMYQLGFMYEIGIGVNKNKDKAKEWYRKAEAAGHKWIPEL